MFKSLFGGRDEMREESEGLFFEGMAAASRYECAKAISLFSRSIDLNANRAAYLGRSRLLIRRQRYMEALADLQQAKNLNEAQERDLLKEIDEEIYNVKPLCHHHLSGNREKVISLLKAKIDDPYAKADIIKGIWRGALSSVSKPHLYRSLSRFHFFNELDNIKKFNGFEFYPTVEGYWTQYPGEFVDFELGKGCPDGEAYVLMCAHVGSALCLLDEKDMAGYREAIIYQIHGELMTDDYGLWGTLSSEDRGIIRDASDFLDANPHLGKS